MVKIQRYSGQKIVHPRTFGAEIRVLNRGVGAGAEYWIQIFRYLSEALKKARISWLTILDYHGIS